MGSTIFEICLNIFCTELTPWHINYLLREGFSKDYTKGSIVPVKLQVVDRLWPVKLYVYEGKYSLCVVSAG